MRNVIGRLKNQEPEGGIKADTPPHFQFETEHTVRMLPSNKAFVHGNSQSSPATNGLANHLRRVVRRAEELLLGGGKSVSA